MMTERKPFDPSWVKPEAPTAAPADRRVLTVSELTRLVKGTLEDRFARVWVTGEISNLRRPGSGHVYLTLKDAESQLSAVMWRGAAARLRFRLEDGIEVIVGGMLTVYGARGQYQIIIQSIEPKGIGALQLAFKQLVEKLRKEGLFDPEHRKPLPAFPRHIGIVTSPTGAAIHDILQVLDRRCPIVPVTLYPVRVQGVEAAREIAEAIDEMNRLGWFDVLIVGRGGGSLEDLWAFNEELVARAIYRSRIPVVSAVGHEIDVTISDMVADRRALTPTEAGELVVPRLDQIEEQLVELTRRLTEALRGDAKLARMQLATLGERLSPAHLAARVRELAQRTDDAGGRLPAALAALVRQVQVKLAAFGGKLESLSPLAVLARGYSITMRLDGEVLRDASQVQPGDSLRTRLAKGEVISKVEDHR